MCLRVRITNRTVAPPAYTRARLTAVCEAGSYSRPAASAGRLLLQPTLGTAVAVADGPDSLILHRIFKPIRPADLHKPLCSCTLIIVQLVPRQGSNAHLLVRACEACGRPVGTPGQRCRQHQHASRFELWAVRRPTGPRGHSMTTPQQEFGAEARLLQGHQSVRQLADALELARDGFRKLSFVDHWGQWGVQMQDLLVRPGSPAALPPVSSSNSPVWLSAMAASKAKKARVARTGLQLHLEANDSGCE
ncbi:hypothetical protein V8C86DRAFT_2939695, partial [Haematococcus lacustris]